jgi:hypothetical protein
MRGGLKDGVQIRALPAGHHAVDRLADQAPRYAKDAGRLEPLKRVRDRLTAKPRCRLQNRVRRRAKLFRSAQEAQDKGAKHAQAYLAHNAVAGSWRPCAAFYGFGKGKNAGSFVSIDRSAVLTRIGNKARAAAKAISHGDVSQAWARKPRSGQPSSFSEMACDVGENQRGKVLPHTFFAGSPGSKPAYPSGFFAFTGHAGLKLETPLARFTGFRITC